jgi:hypothetical protein
MSQKTGRNQPCPCGSRKKYKRCHGAPSRLNPPGYTRIDPFQTVKDRLEVAERIRQNQQGLGKRVIAAKVGPLQVVAVGAQVYWSDKWRTFPDFLSDYLKTLLGPEWGDAELAKPLEQRHPLMKWYDAYCRYQQSTMQRPGELTTAPITGIVACYLGLAYSLYLLQHNSEIQKRLIDRLKHPDQFQGAYYEIMIANVLLRAGFDLMLEDETDGDSKHCEFAAVSRATGVRYWVEAKMKAVAGVLGATEGLQHPNPLKGLIRLLNRALEKPAPDKRLVFIDLNIGVDSGQRGTPAWGERVGRRLALYEREYLAPGVEAYVFVTNMAFHRQLEVPPMFAAMPYGLGIHDFNKPGPKRLSDAYLEKKKHADAHQIGEAFLKYLHFPQTFDGTMPSDALDHRRPMIGETYHFDDGKGGTVIGTVTAATVSEAERKVVVGIMTPTGESIILRRPMSEAELNDYKLNREAYFGRLTPQSRQSKDALEFHQWLMDAHKGLSRETLLERMPDSPEIERLRSAPDDELLAIYCEGIVASMPR